MAYDPTVFVRGQQYRHEVSRILAAQRIELFRLPERIDAGEIIRKSFYGHYTAEHCAGLILAELRLRRA